MDAKRARQFGLLEAELIGRAQDGLGQYRLRIRLDFGAGGHDSMFPCRRCDKE